MYGSAATRKELSRQGDQTEIEEKQWRRNSYGATPDGRETRGHSGRSPPDTRDSLNYRHGSDAIGSGIVGGSQNGQNRNINYMDRNPSGGMLLSPHMPMEDFNDGPYNANYRGPLR